MAEGNTTVSPIPPHSADAVNALMRRMGYNPNKALGQNFLIDTAATERILDAACVCGKNVLEIGAGLGALTYPLNVKAAHLVAVDIDNTIVKLLEGERGGFPNPDKLDIICGDILHVDIDGLFPHDVEFAVVANLPYYITTPICMRLLRMSRRIPSMTLMMQEEAAQRFFAEPKSKQYGPMTVLARYMYDVSRVCKLSPQSYYPQPEVDSVVLHFKRRQYDAGIIERLDALLRTGFAMRRKTLVNNLTAAGHDKDAVLNALDAVGPGVRGEALSVEEWVTLARRL